MATSWKSQQSEGKYALQFETDSKEKYKLVEKVAQMAVDGKTIDDVVEVRPGEWEFEVKNPLVLGQFRCSVCGVTNGIQKSDWCPHCGAKMDGEGEKPWK